MNISSVGASSVKKPSYFEDVESKIPDGTLSEVVDSAEISESAKQMSQLNQEMANIRKRIDSLPDIREAKILSVIEKIESGYYQNNTFLEEVAA